MTPQEAFVIRLRRHRERQRVALDEIAAEMRVKPEALQAFERNDLSEWPRGVYARAWIRAYASSVGLDPIDTVDEFCRLFPQGDRRVRPTIAEIAAIVAHPSEYIDDIRPEEERRSVSAHINMVSPTSWHAAAGQAVASAGRALILRAVSVLDAAQPRDKQQPRTTS
jgi:cytoskeletal protein RodZ